MTIESTTPVLEIGGTHVTAALVQQHDDGWTVQDGSLTRLPLDAHASAEVLLGTMARAAHSLGSAHNTRWGVALPGPFDYDHGIGRYQNVGKFETLNGFNVKEDLSARLGPLASTLTFLNDADAFGIGEHALRTPASARLVCITLGTGVGSAFLIDGVPAKTGPGVPPDGCCHLIEFRGQALEDTVSRRAIRRQYMEARGGSEAGSPEQDVHEIAELCRQGDEVAAHVLDSAFTSLGEAIAPYLHCFGAESLIIGGSMAGSWDLVLPAVRDGLTGEEPSLARLPIVRSDRFEEACLIGAAQWVQRQGNS
ncbi:ROK family protein [Arthrobacter subterraneus]|uniref:ROK family protein n=1 Tax=Arthrobacter subterraneus TaxID=335973 RepID=UPI00381C8CE6